jgi:hypothetical protein
MFIFVAAPAEINPTPAVNFGLPAVATEADEFRPTAGSDFVPTPEEEAEAAELLNGDEPEPDWDTLAEESAMMDRHCLGCYGF